MTTEVSDPIPQNYEQWRHCIEHWCGIELTPDYIEQRLQALQDSNNHHTRRFIECYGEPHHSEVLGWFRRAQQDSGAKPG